MCSRGSSVIPSENNSSLIMSDFQHTLFFLCVLLRSNQFILQEVWGCSPRGGGARIKGTLRQLHSPISWNSSHFLLTFAQLSGSRGSLSWCLHVKLQPCPPTLFPSPVFSKASHTQTQTHPFISILPLPGDTWDKLSTFAGDPRGYLLPFILKVLKD